MQAIDQNARTLFESEIHKYKCANIGIVQTCYRALPLSAHRTEYLNGKRGKRDSARAKAHLAASDLKNAEGRVLSYLLALGQMGYNSVVVTEEVNANQCEMSTGGPCAPRTFRRGLAGIRAKRWVSTRLISTGTRIIVGTGPTGQPIWKSLRVNKITLTPAAKLLIAKGPVFDIAATADLPTIEHKSIPRPKGPTIKEKESLQASKIQPGELSLEIGTTSKDVEHQVDTSTTKEVEMTQPCSKLNKPIGHHASTATSRRPIEKASLFRRNRNKTPRTWSNARKLLLHELTLHAKEEPLFETLYRITELQTDLRYPRLCFNALNWDNWLPMWLDLSWKQRKRVLQVHLLPELVAFCAHLDPPNVQLLDSIHTTEKQKAEIHQQLAGYRQLKNAMADLPKKIFFHHKREKISGYDSVRARGELATEETYILETIPWFLNSGKLLLDNLKQKEHEAFNSAADTLGIND